MNESSEIKFTKEDREKLKKELEKEQEEQNIENKKEEDEKKKEEKQNKKEKTKTKHKTKKKHSKEKDKKDKKNKKEKRDKKKDKKEKSSNTVKVPISYLIIILILLGIIIAIGVFYYLENEKSVEFTSEWEQVYYTFLENGIIKKGKDGSGNDLENSSPVYMEKNPKVYMLDVEDITYPIMITESNGIKENYKAEENKDVKNIYTVHSIGYNRTVNYDIYYNIENIVFLYNIETNDSQWYLHSEDIEEKQDVYIPVNEVVTYSKENTSEYRFADDDEFKNTFIEINVNVSKYKLIENMSENRLKNIVKKASDSMKRIDNVLTEKNLEKIKKQLKENQDEKTQEDIEDNKEEESIQETSNSLKVGSYTISYGKYSNDAITITLKNGGACKYEDSDNEIDESCTYEIEGDSNSYFQLVVSILDDTKYFIINGNNKLGNLSYQG